MNIKTVLFINGIQNISIILNILYHGSCNFQGQIRVSFQIVQINR